MRAAYAAAGPARIPLTVVLAIALGLAFASYPATTLLATLVAGVVILALYSPPLGLGAAILLFAFEGSVKILLGLEGSPLPGTDREAGAAALDLALFVAVAAVLYDDRLRAPRSVWSSASRAERITIGLIAAWLALSVVQIAQGGDIERGLKGFRLFHSYALVALATLTVFAHPRLRPAALKGALAIGLVASAYAALRVAIGPADAEREFALEAPTVTEYGTAFRAVGSFSSAVGLISFLAPVAGFAAVLGLLTPRLRVPALTVAALAIVGLIGSYSRASLFGVALGLGCGLLFIFAASEIPIRRKLAATGAVIAIVAAAYGGLVLASSGVPELRERAEGVLDPFDDESAHLRYDTWERSWEDAVDHPLGQGVGEVSSASATADASPRTTDNSFLKVLVDQGFLGLALFGAGVGGAVVLLARRLRRLPPAVRPVGLAALAGFVAFLGISLSGDYVEQPGKVAAWGLLGIAAAYAFFGSAGTTRGADA